MAAETLGGEGLHHVIQSSPAGLNWLDFTEIIKVKAATQVGEFVTSASETAGDPADLAAAGDADTGTVYLVIERVDSIPQDIDTEIAANSFVRAMRPTGGKFEVACFRTDESTSLLKGQKLVLGATGLLITMAYTDTAEATDTHMFLVELSRDATDPDPGVGVVYIWF